MSTPSWVPASYCWSCQKVLITLLEGAAAPLPRALIPLAASWLLCALAGLSLPTLPGKDLVWAWYGLLLSFQCCVYF